MININLLSVDYITVNSYESRKGTLVVTSVNESYPEFVQIEHIFVFERKFFYWYKSGKHSYSYRHYRAYEALPSNSQQTLLPFDHIKFQRPLHVTMSSNVNDMFYYVTTREEFW